MSSRHDKIHAFTAIAGLFIFISQLYSSRLLHEPLSNGVVSLGNGTEWRVIGVESSLQREFGNYLQFRYTLSDSSANAVYLHQSFFTFAFYSEIAAKLKNGSIGYQLAYITDTRRLKAQFPEPNYRKDYLRLHALVQTLQLTNNRYTWYAQQNFGTYAMSFQAGMNYRLR